MKKKAQKKNINKVVSRKIRELKKYAHNIKKIRKKVEKSAKRKKREWGVFLSER